MERSQLPELQNLDLEWAEKWLARGVALVMLDGFFDGCDEVPEDKRPQVSQVIIGWDSMMTWFAWTYSEDALSFDGRG